MHAGSWESTREAFEWHQAKLSTSLASRVLSLLLKCIHNSTDAKLNHGPFLLEHCHCHFIQHLKKKYTLVDKVQNSAKSFRVFLLVERKQAI